MSDTKETDHWSAEAYSNSASFVPKLTRNVLEYLDAKPTERILDVGCGDGKFTADFIPKASFVLGIDASPSMIKSATQDYGGPNAEFQVVDCRELPQQSDVANGTWDKVMSNAALHWIMKDASTRLAVLQGVYKSLRPGGSFIFEMGCHGNCSEVHTALLSAFVHHGGKPIEEAREASPWFFPSENWMRKTLEGIGFSIEKLEVEYRPTKLTTNESGGIQGWVRLMAASMLEKLDEDRREAAVAETCDLLESIITRDEDGSKWLGYVRLRGIANKKSGK